LSLNSSLSSEKRWDTTDKFYNNKLTLKGFFAHYDYVPMPESKQLKLKIAIKNYKN